MKLMTRSMVSAACLSLSVAFAQPASAQQDVEKRVAAIKQWLGQSKAHYRAVTLAVTIGSLPGGTGYRKAGN